MMTTGLDRRAVLAGALVDLVMFLPLVVGVAILKHNDVATQEFFLWIASAVAIFLAPAVGGAVAGRRRADTPLTHGAAAAGLAFVAFLVFRIVDGAASGHAINAGQAILFLIITVSMGMVGAYLGFRAPSLRRGRSNR
jgi:putative membrane protein (TIGR04086 family)